MAFKTKVKAMIGPFLTSESTPYSCWLCLVSKGLSFPKGMFTHSFLGGTKIILDRIQVISIPKPGEEASTE